MIFKGISEHTLDEKGRLFMPARYREGLGETMVFCPSFFHKCVWAFSARDFEALAEKMDFSLLDEDAQGVERVFYAGACDVEADKAGRVVIPPQLRDYAGLEKDVIVAGSRNRVEVWDRTTYQAQNLRDQEAFRDTLRQLKEQGVRV